MANCCMIARSQSAETGFRCIFRDRRQVARNQPMRRSTAEDRMGQVLSFEMNEVIFPYLEKYISQGHLPTFAKLFREYGYVETSSEERFSDIEPWIQWVSVRTGKTFKEHGVFRLGDMVAADCQQIWEHLEERGFRVGAISPMNAANRLKHPSFFMPDPWTDTSASGSYLLVRLYDAIKQAVNDNSQKRITPRSAFYLALGLLWYAKLTSAPTYVNVMSQLLRGHGWAQAIFLDRFLADMFIRLCVKKRPQYASLFLNGAAHFQHHYLYNSRAYEGAFKNPSWYLSSDLDPLLEMFRAYDDILRDALRMPTNPRIMIGTALQQEPHGRANYHYRLKNHEVFFRTAGIDFSKMHPLMARDFVIEFDTPQKAAAAAQILSQASDAKGERLFSVDNRGLTLYMELVYISEVKPGLAVTIGNHAIDDFHAHVAFIAIRNAHHNGTGYFLDTGCRAWQRAERIPIVALWDRINTAVA
jgi:hypothetical protein